MHIPLWAIVSIVFILVIFLAYCFCKAGSTY